MLQAAGFVVMTILAGGAGWGMGRFMDVGKAAPETAIVEAAPTIAPADTPKTETGHGAAPDAHSESGNALLDGNALSLDPMVTNLSSPSDVWVRLEMSLVVEPGMEPELVQAVQQDIFSYLRSVHLNQFEGPSGFINMKSDILERAKIRTEGKVKAVLIKTLLFE